MFKMRNTRLQILYLLILGSFVIGLPEIVIAKNEKGAIIKSIEIEGNKITRKNTIVRELGFAELDTVLFNQSVKLFVKAEQNLMNTSLFNFVTVKPIWSVDSSSVNIQISVLERWYVWPYPLLEIADRNFNAWWEEKDFSRLNYGVYLDWWNFTGRKDRLKILLRFGHEQKFGLFYNLPSLNRTQTLGFEVGISHARKHEIGVASVHNKLIYHRNSDIYLEEKSEFYLRLFYRSEIHQKQYIELKYQHINFTDSILLLYPNHSVNNYNNLKHFSIAYKYSNDHRDYKPYPLEGHYFDVELRKVGLGLLQSDGVDFLYVKSNLKYFRKLKHRWYYAASLLAKFSTNQFQPYSLQRGLGFDYDYVRGYELNIFDGQNYGLFRSNLKFELIPQKLHNIKIVKSEKFSKMYYSFYLNLFLDVAYTHDRYNSKLNPLVNEFQYGYGIGLDFVTYYDIVLRTEFTFNKQNKGSLFFHVRAPL
jgi:outer membrane protein assembly factor BamA